MLYLDLFCASLIKMCPQVSEKCKRTHKDVMLSVKLDQVCMPSVIKCCDHSEYRIGIVLMMNFQSGTTQTFSHIN